MKTVRPGGVADSATDERKKLIRKIRRECQIKVIAEPEHIPVRGNALASGDDFEDEQYENEIIRRQESGDVWSWCTVIVRVAWLNLIEEDVLGGCTYADEKDFRRPGGYYDDMRDACIDRIAQCALRVGKAVQNAD